ncbi:SRPBCC domain-containing protein [Tuanshanicoccus lijuaniae]|uniref:SRPBCC domain-containing protein n=1 Tax=Aerococcaceae bacterium zg-1292 TaxID=2774330 RepID=UPI004064A092
MTINFDGDIAVSPDFLWNIIVNETDQWFSELEWTDFRAGGTLEYRSDDSMEDYMILDVEAPELLAFTWEQSTIAIELVANDDDLTTIRFSNWIEIVSESTAHYLTRWMIALQTLAAYAQDESIEADISTEYEEILPKMREMLALNETDVEFE